MNATQPKKVLIVDDDLGILEALKFMLENSGYEVKTVSRGDEALPVLKEFGPDIVLLDLYLSGFDGRDIAVEIKNSPEGKNTPIAMISAHPSAGEVLKELDIEEFLPKPFDVSQLLSVIEKHTSASR
ncbi:MAG TPA: response regulator [Candidatus Paceibacterota bacterium]|jgi:DNA-binding response OmpR family regulator|nr:response regulator [Candidatus Paceibacterota bacterium]